MPLSLSTRSFWPWTRWSLPLTRSAGGHRRTGHGEKTGARALRAILEEVMLDIMYEIPKDDSIGSVRITRGYIENTGGPVITLRNTPVPLLESAGEPGFSAGRVLTGSPGHSLTGTSLLTMDGIFQQKLTGKVKDDMLGSTKAVRRECIHE